jgi:hypothetical protein
MITLPRAEFELRNPTQSRYSVREHDSVNVEVSIGGKDCNYLLGNTKLHSALRDLS